MAVIYLDNAATTKMDESLIKVYQSFSCQDFYNPSAGYDAAIKNSQNLQYAREVILKKLNAKVGDIIFTSGATESNNLAIRGSLREGKWEYLFSCVEHPSVFNVAKELEQNSKIVKFIPVKKSGEVDYNKLEEMVNEKTRLVSVMFVNNETGVINDLKKVCQIVKSKNPQTLVHVDGVQGFGKILIDLSKVDVDFFTISAHKFHGPKGVGVLYVKNKSALKSIVFGGGQEFGIRSGTENLPAIMAMAKRVEDIDIIENFKQTTLLKETFLSSLDLNVVKHIDSQSPYILSLSFPKVNGETLMRALENKVIVGTGSACSTKKSGNRVLESMGFDMDYIKSCIRVSFNPYQTIEEVKKAGQIIMKTYKDIYERIKWKSQF